MKINHSEDYVTDVVIGGGEAEEFEIADTANFYIMLSDSLYSNKPKAVARETLCNAWDSHIDSGIQDIPLDITVTDTHMIVRDYGSGIAPDMMKPLYGTYGGTDKLKKRLQTGGFGLGCKSPFAIASNFTVTSYYNHVKTVYNISKKSGDIAGKPSMKSLLSIATTESGLKVEIPIPKGTKEQYIALYKTLIRCGSINAKVNGEHVVDIFPAPEDNEGFIFQYLVHELSVRYGNVIYPIPICEDYAHLHNKVDEIVKALTSSYTNGCSNHNLVLEILPDMLSITPSRESISLTPQSIQSIKDAMQSFIGKFIAQRVNFKQGTLNYFNNVSCSNPSIPLTNINNLYRDVGVKNNHQHLYSNINQYKDLFNLCINDPTVRHQIRNILPNITKQYINIKKEFIMNSGFINSKLYHQLVKSDGIINNYDNKKALNIVFKNIIAPIKLALINQTEISTKSRIYINNGSGVINIDRLSKQSNNSYFTIINNKVAFIGNTITEIQETCWQATYKYRGYLDPCGSISLVVPRNKAKIKAGKKLLENLGYFVIDLTTTKAAVVSDAVNAPKAAKIKKPKGLPAFDNILENDMYIASARFRNPTLPHIESPEFVVMCTDRTDKGEIAGIPVSIVKYICRKYKLKGAITSTHKKYDKAIADGALPIREWVDNTLSNIIKNDYTLQYAIANKYIPKSRYNTKEDLIKTSLSSDLILNKYVYNKKPVFVSDIHKEFIAMLDDVCRYYRRSYPLPKTYNIYNFYYKIKPNKKIRYFIERINKSEELPYLNIDRIGDVISDTNISMTDRNKIKIIYKYMDIILGISK